MTRLIKIGSMAKLGHEPIPGFNPDQLEIIIAPDPFSGY
jgi:hypothetical protein